MSVAVTNACPFCSVPGDRLVAESTLTATVRDAYPVSKGHTLVILKRHVESFFDATAEEKAEMVSAIEEAKLALEREVHPDGYNIGLNVGSAAGQTVMHVHAHLIPRFRGDVADPRGGVRHCIPGKGYYEPTT